MCLKCFFLVQVSLPPEPRQLRRQLGPSQEGHPQGLVPRSARVSAPRCQRPLLQCARSRLCLLPQARCRHRRVPCRLLFQSIRRRQQPTILVTFHWAFKPFRLARVEDMYGHLQGPPAYGGSAPFPAMDPRLQPSFSGTSAFGGSASSVQVGFLTQPLPTRASAFGGSASGTPARLQA